MVKVIFKTPDGDKDVELQPGERVLKGAYRLGLDEQGFGECGGNCVCSTCHVYVLEGAQHFPAPKPEEEDMLDTVFTVKPNSRLACQLVLSSEHEQVVVEWPARS